MDGHRKGVDNQHLMKSNGLQFPSFLFFTSISGKRGKYIKVSFKRKCSLAKEGEQSVPFSNSSELFFMANARTTTTTQSGISDKQVQEVVEE